MSKTKVLALAAAGLVWGAGVASADIPLNYQFEYDNLEGPVEVIWDQYEIPHIYATTVEDAYFVQGWVTASKRLFAMDMTRRFAGGRLAELIGEELLGFEAFEEDVDSRWTGFNRIAAQNYALLEPEEQGELLSYAAGVNAFIDFLRTPAGTTSMPSEYFLLSTTPDLLQYWTPEDSLTVLAYQAVGHVLDMGDDFSLLRRTRGWAATFEQEGNPREGLMDLFFTCEPTSKVASAFAWNSGPPVPPAPNAIGTSLFSPGWSHFQGLLTGQVRNEVLDRVLGDYLERRPGYRFAKSSSNSNAWAVRGSLTKTGHPMFAADPHLGLSNPPIMFQNHINIAGSVNQNTAGVTIPGLPGVSIGFSEFCAWGLTNGQIDTTDTYVEQVVKGPFGEPAFVRFNEDLVPITRIIEKVRVKTAPGVFDDRNVVLLSVPHHGMVVKGSWDPDTNTLITFKNAGYDGTYEYRAFRNLNGARSVYEIWDGLDNVTNGQAFVFADSQDNVMFTSGYRSPIRSEMGLRPETPPWFSYDGRGDFEWQGLHERSEMPWVINPDQNFIATSNQDPIGVTFDGNPLPTEPGDIYIGDLWDIGFRNDRIAEMITNAAGDRAPGEKIDLDFMKRIQSDTKSAMGSRLVPGILDAIAANPDGLANTPEITLATTYLTKWMNEHRFDTPAAMEGNITLAEKEASAATTLFNYWLVRFLPAAIQDEMDAAAIGFISANGSTYGLRGVLKAWFEEADDFILWDNLTTTGTQETKNQLILTSLQAAVTAVQAKFNSTDPLTWKWGSLHRLTLEHLMGFPSLSLPPAGTPGFPRHGDGYAIDACGDYVRGDRFTYDDGPAYRLVVELEPGNVKAFGALPGGQDGRQGTAHHSDALELWRHNQYNPIYFYRAEIEANAERMDRFGPDPWPTLTPTPTNTQVPTATPTETPSTAVSIDLDASFDAQGARNLEVDMKVVNSSTTTFPVSLYVAVEVGGGFYFYPSYTEAAVPVATFGLPPIDTGWFNLVTLNLPDPLGVAVTITWYAAFINTDTGQLEGNLADSPVTLE